MPAFNAIGDENKSNPLTRHTADHSMVYIVSTLLRKAFEKHKHIIQENEPEDLWKYLMLVPHDYSHSAIFNE